MVITAYALIGGLIVAGMVGWAAWIAFLGVPFFLGTMRLIARTSDWVELDRHGYRIRILYFVNGLALIAGLLTR